VPALPPYGLTPGSAPSPPQAEFHAAAFARTYTYLVGGLGSGKSWAGAWQFLFSILENRERLQASGRRGELTYLVGAPSYQLIDAGPWRHLLTLLDEAAIRNGYSLIRGKPLRTHPREIRLTTGDTIKFISTDAGRFAGINAAGCWYDEAEEATDPVGGFHLLDNRLRDVRSPRLFFLVTSTPGVAGQGVARMFKQRIAEGDSGYAMVSATTASNPAYADGDYVSRRRATMSLREARAKLDGEILPPEGAVYGLEFDEFASLATDWRYPTQLRRGDEINLAIDWGGHYWAGLVHHDRERDRDVVFDQLILDGVQPDVFCREVVEHCRKRWALQAADVTGVWCDYNPRDARLAAYRFWPGRVHHRRVRNHQDRISRINTLRWRLLDADGVRRLQFAPSLRRTTSNRGVLDSLQNQKNVEVRVDGFVVETDRPVQESIYSHACDALGYMVWCRYSHLRFTDEGRAAA